MSKQIEHLTLIMTPTQEKVILEHVTEEELIKLYTTCLHRPGSRRFHNQGIDGLFLHLCLVTHNVQKTKGYSLLPLMEQRLITIMALYHDYYSKVDDERDGNSKTRAFSTFAPVIAKFEEFISALYYPFPLTNIGEESGFDLASIHELMACYLHAWQWNHHGFIDGIPDMRLSQRFIMLLFEVSRCDSYDAAYSTGIRGSSVLSII